MHSMNKRPFSVTIIGWLFLATGAIEIASHVTALKVLQPFPYDVVLVLLLGVIAVICGVYILRGSNWARWLAVTWLAFHVIVGAFNSVQQFLMHGLLLAVLAYFLLRSEARAYFRA